MKRVLAFVVLCILGITCTKKETVLTQVYSGTANSSLAEGNFKTMTLANGMNITFNCDTAFITPPSASDTTIRDTIPPPVIEEPEPQYDTVFPLIIPFGSSSVALGKWNAAFPQHNILVRGFGGKTFGHLYTYVRDTITKRRPAQVILWCGENDILARERGVSFYAADLIWTFKKTFNLLRQENPGAHIAVMEIRNTPRTNNFFEKENQATPYQESSVRTVDSSNALVRKFLATQSNTTVIPINDLLEGKSYYFSSDGLHLTTRAYNEVVFPRTKQILKDPIITRK